MGEQDMAQFSLVQAMMFGTSRTVRELCLTATTCIIWEPRRVGKTALCINLFGTGIGLFDFDAVQLGKNMATMQRPVAMRGFGRFTLYRFGQRQATG